MALYVCTIVNCRFVGMAPRRKPRQKGKQPNMTTRSSRTRVSAALGAPPPAATMRLAFEETEEMQAILHSHGATASNRSTWESGVEGRLAASERMLNEMHGMLQLALATPAGAANPASDPVVSESPGERSASREPVASLARETASGQDVSTAPPWPSLHSAATGMHDILQGLPCATQERVASLTAPSLSIHAHVPEKVKSKIWADEYVEFSSLLKHKNSFKQDYTLSIQTPSMDSDPVFRVSPTAQPELRTFQQWCRAFEVFMSIYTTRPHKGVEAPKLLKYLQTVRNLAERGGDWRAYDESFRSLRMTHGWEWDSVHWEMWMSAAQPQQPTVPKTFPSAGSSFHGKDGARPRGKHCFAFNRGDACSAKTCGFKHVCKRCAGNHPFVRCTSGQRNPGKQNNGSGRQPVTTQFNMHK